MREDRPRGRLNLRQLKALFVGAPPMALHHYINREPKRVRKGEDL